jgi:GntR family transcriptional regulator, arabinose operon transcriptional repressor
LLERKVGSGSYVRLHAEPAGFRFGLLIPGLSGTEIYGPICKRIVSVAQRWNHSILWGDFGDSQEPSRELIRQACASYVRQGVSGVFFAPLELNPDKDLINEEVVSTLRAAHIPIVLLDRDLVAFPGRSPYDLVGIDNRRAGYVVTSHLLRQGCTRVDFLSGLKMVPTALLRLAGYREALLNARIALESSWVHAGNPADEPFVDTMVKRGARAIVCANDGIAAVLMKSLSALGYELPKKVRIVGFDDVRYAELLHPALTTIRQPCAELGEIAMQAMIQRIQHPSFPPRDILAHAQLIVRQSCGS